MKDPTPLLQYTSKKPILQLILANTARDNSASTEATRIFSNIKAKLEELKKYEMYPSANKLIDEAIEEYVMGW